MKIRLVLQPLVSVVFAIRAGRRDAREGRPPYLWTILSRAPERRGLLKESWLDVGRVFLAAVAIDLVYQFAVLRTFHPGEAAIVAATLALLPYFAARGLVTRISRKLGLD